MAAARSGGGVAPGGGKPNKPNNNGPSGGVKPGKGPPGKYGGGKKTPWHRQEERRRERERREREANAQNPSPAPAAPTPAPTPYQPPPDPRDDQYWANRRALEAQFNIQNEQLNMQQVQANNAFALESAQMDEYNNRRQRAIAEARMGRGLRSGGFRRERTLNDMDYMMDTGRRQQAKADADFDRSIQQRQLRAQLDADLQQEDIDSFNRLSEGMIDQSINSPGDSQDMEATFAAEDKAARNAQLTKQLKTVNSRIKALKAKRDNAGPKQKQRIDARIKRLSGKRTKIKGKIDG